MIMMVMMMLTLLLFMCERPCFFLQRSFQTSQRVALGQRRPAFPRFIPDFTKRCVLVTGKTVQDFSPGKSHHEFSSSSSRLIVAWQLFDRVLSSTQVFGMPPKRGRAPKKAPVETKAESKSKKAEKPAKRETSEEPEDSDESAEFEVPEKPQKKGRAPKKQDKEEKNATKKEPKKRGKRAADDDEEPEPAPKRARTETKNAKAEPKQPMNKTDSNLEEIDFDCEKENADGKKYNFKISSWNVSGIRAVIKKSAIDYIRKEDADIVALQETKCDKDKIPDEVKLKGYHYYFLDSKKSGYCGVALYTKEKPIQVKYGLDDEEFDNEGRLITAEYPGFYLINVYVPNAGAKLVTLPKRLKWNETFKTYVKDLDKKKPVIICGDMNVAHQEIDLKNPKTNMKNAGFTKEERDGMTDFLASGFVDTFRAFYPDKTDAYTFWSYFANARSKNIGWRLDYFLVSERINNKVCDNIIRDKVYGSDHCPIVLYINL